MTDSPNFKIALAETSDAEPALASHGKKLFLAWKSSGDGNLNIMFSDDDGATFRDKQTFGDSSDYAPAPAFDGTNLCLEGI